MATADSLALGQRFLDNLVEDLDEPDRDEDGQADRDQQRPAGCVDAGDLARDARRAQAWRGLASLHRTRSYPRGRSRSRSAGQR